MTNKKECCGCTACMHVCPVKCIAMHEDEEGFLYPAIEKEKCIHCHKCEKVCPIRNADNLDRKTETFAGYNRNEEIRKQSSSGGVFSVIAEWILEQDGVVFGAASDENFEIHHIAVESKEELEKLRGSKYVQSRLENVYPEVKQYLEMDHKVLFAGTACQIAGLKKYLDKEYENLYTVDVLCHGVPSPKIWRMYLEEMKRQYNALIEKVEFRNKEAGWKNYSMNIEFSNKQYFCVRYFNDKYMRMFLENIDLRPSCYSCHFKGFPRISDMTIGDSWGIEKYMPDMDDDKGTSIIFLHSLKGKRIFDSIKKNLIVREVRLYEALSQMDELRKSVEMHPNRKKFWEGVKRGENIDTLYGYVQKNFVQKIISLIRYMGIRLKYKLIKTQ